MRRVLPNWLYLTAAHANAGLLCGLYLPTVQSGAVQRALAGVGLYAASVLVPVILLACGEPRQPPAQQRQLPAEVFSKHKAHTSSEGQHGSAAGQHHNGPEQRDSPVTNGTSTTEFTFRATAALGALPASLLAATNMVQRTHHLHNCDAASNYVSPLGPQLKVKRLFAENQTTAGE